MLLEYPEFGKATTPQIDYFAQYMQSAFAAMNQSYSDATNGLTAFWDADSYWEYFWTMELIKNPDAGSHSTYAFKERGGKLRLVPWDGDQSIMVYQGGAPDPFQSWIGGTILYSKSLADPNGLAACMAKFQQMYPQMLDTAYAAIRRYEQECAERDRV